MKTLVRILVLSAALAGAFVLARQQKLLRPIVRYFKPPVPLGEYRDPTLEQIAAYCAGVRDKLNAKDYPGLSAMAKQARESKERFANGAWKLDRFYDAFSPPRADADGLWVARLQQVNAWLAAQPADGAPSIALANVYVDYAWKARGGGYADTVTPIGWQLFAQRLGAANQILERAPAAAKQDPEFYQIRHVIARGSDWPRHHLDAILAAGLKLEPQYNGFYTVHAFALLPRWGGRPGEMEQFAAAATKVPGGLGDEAYARIAWMMDDTHTDIFRQTKLQWPLVESGCKALLERYPDDPSLISAYAMLACRSGDTTTARRLFEELDDRVDLRIWKNVEMYKRHYNHANPSEPK